MKKFALCILLSLLFPITTYPHSGGTNADGCHTNRKTGEYHCHSKKSKSSPRKSPSHKPSQSEESEAAQSYNRKNWKHWIDADRDCQNTRHEILIRDSNAPVLFKSGRSCKVVGGEWYGPYTGKVFISAKEMDIDHIVPLKHAYSTGGSSWSREDKKRFANDYDNLLAVDKSANRQKGAKGPSEWMPSNQTYWCEYGQRWRSVKDKYGLIISNSEEQALNRMEQHCE